MTARQPRTRNNRFDLGSWFKKLFGVEDRPNPPPPPHVIYTQPQPISILPQLEMYVNGQVTLDPKLVSKITDLQKLTTSYLSKVKSEPECCICFEIRETIYLRCQHTLCKKCYEDMITHTYNFSEDCPICQTPMRIFKPVNSNYVLVTHLGDFSMGLVMNPMVHDIPNNININSMIVKNLMTSTYAGSGFENFVNYLLYKEYMLIFTDEVSLEIMSGVMDLKGYKTEILSRL